MLGAGLGGLVAGSPLRTLHRPASAGEPYGGDVSIDELLRAAGAAMQATLTLAEPLRSSHRSVVVRAVVDGGPETVIVKTFDQARAWVGESAALAVLRGRGAPVPELVAVAEQPPLIVTRDLGSGPSLADALLGGDPQVATDRLASWALALAGVHSATIGTGTAFTAAMNDRLPADSMPSILAGVRGHGSSG